MMIWEAVTGGIFQQWYWHQEMHSSQHGLVFRKGDHSTVIALLEHLLVLLGMCVLFLSISLDKTEVDSPDQEHHQAQVDEQISCFSTFCSATTVQFWTMVWTWTFQNWTKVQFQVQRSGWAEGPGRRKGGWTCLNLFEPGLISQYLWWRNFVKDHDLWVNHNAWLRVERLCKRSWFMSELQCMAQGDGWDTNMASIEHIPARATGPTWSYAKH